MDFVKNKKILNLYAYGANMPNVLHTPSPIRTQNLPMSLTTVMWQSASSLMLRPHSRCITL